jgi:hypothetical protein
MAGLVGVWMSSPIVAVGDVTNITRYGKQTVDRLPPPTMPGVHELYWCIGDFHLAAVVKGKLWGASRRYLWASTFPECRILPDDPAAIANKYKTLAWFLREEGGFLRPTFDWGAYPFLGLFIPWNAGPPVPPRQRLGTLLLTPTATCGTAKDYAECIWQVGDIACELLGKTECTKRIRDLSLQSPLLREPACNFLKGQLAEDCDAPR